MVTRSTPTLDWHNKQRRPHIQQRALPLVLSFVTASCVQSQEVLTRSYLNTQPEAGVEREHDAGTTDAPDATSPLFTTEHSPRDERRDASFEYTPNLAAPDVVVGTGYFSTCASVFGKLYCWGDNSYGQLGTFPDRPLEWPTRLQVDFVAASIDGGERHMCALNTGGSVYCWGANDDGQLGQGDRNDRYEPTGVYLPEPVRQLSSGESHVCVVTESGQLYGWGWNKEGQLALSDDASDDAQQESDVLTPTLIDRGPWTMVSAGQGHSCGTRTDGTLWCWGRNYNRQVGQYEGERFRTPQQVGADTDWKFVVAGQTHSCALRNNHTLWCWGSNLEGQPYPLGAEWAASEDDPEYASDAEWQTLDTRWMSSCGFTLNGEALCWGRNEEGQLGLNDFEFRNGPTFVAKGGIQISTGLLHTCGVSEDLDVYCTGNNESGELGTGDFQRKNQFTRVRF
jgi:alpha-tubulin suppressor-like RCC1 family protein